MEAKIASKELSAALDPLGKVVQASSASPVYQCVLMEAKGRQLTFKGTDQSVFMETTARLKRPVDEPFTILVSYSAIAHYAKLAGAVITLSPTKSELRMRTATDKAVAKLRDPNDFMRWPDWSSLSKLNVDIDEFMVAVKGALSCVAVNMIKPVLFNVSLKARGGQIIIQAADGKRLQRTAVKARHAQFDVMLSLSSASKMMQAIGRPDTVAVGKTSLGLKSDYCTVFALLSEGAQGYPDLKSFVSREKVLTVVMDRRGLYKALQRAIGFSSDATVSDVLFSFSDGKLVLKASSKEIGAYTALLSVAKQVGQKDYQVYLNGSDLSSFLQRIDHEKVMLTFAPVHSAANGQVRVINPDAADDLYILYPVIKEGRKKAKA